MAGSVWRRVESEVVLFLRGLRAERMHKGDSIYLKNVGSCPSRTVTRKTAIGRLGFVFFGEWRTRVPSPQGVRDPTILSRSSEL
jgi:hypothetical protein